MSSHAFMLSGTTQTTTRGTFTGIPGGQYVCRVCARDWRVRSRYYSSVSGRRNAVPAMIQSPDSDGPPGLSAYFDRARKSVGTSGAPISVGTGRARCADFDGDVVATAAAALERAADAIEEDGIPQLCHCTLSLDVDPTAVQKTLQNLLSSIENLHVIGRTVNKKDADGTIEIMLLRSDEGAGISYAQHACDVSNPDEQSYREAAMTAAKNATTEAIAGLETKSGCTFLVFAHTPGAPADAVRQGIESASPSVVAYGGPAVGGEETGMGWALFSCLDRDALKGSLEQQNVCVAAVPGCINFLISSVVKSWAQPTYAEPLSYMIPTYIGDPSIDLLTAIRYDDWDKFIWCLEDQGVDVNVLWPEKQNQSPLLAACARVRPRMIEYMISSGANVHHRNAGGFTAAMYTRKLTEYDPKVVLAQLKVLHDAGLDTNLSPEDEKAVRDSGDGRIFLNRVDNL